MVGSLYLSVSFALKNEAIGSMDVGLIEMWNVNNSAFNLMGLG
jgi:hypothetical protein